MLKTNEINFLCSLKTQFTKLFKTEYCSSINYANGTITVHHLINEHNNSITIYKSMDTPLYLKDIDVVVINNNDILKITGGKYEYTKHLNNILQESNKREQVNSSNSGDFIYSIKFPNIQEIDNITEKYETPTYGKLKYITKIVFGVR